MREQSILETATSGSIRFNTDSSKLEIYNGEAWWEIDATSPELQTGGTRLLFGGGYSNSPHPTMTTIDFVNVDTTGNASDFGDLTQGRSAASGGASRTRGIFQGGRNGPAPNDGYNTIDFVTFSSTGNAQNFGDLTGETRNPAKGGLSDQTRSVFAGGYSMPGQTRVNAMEYITIASTGNGVDFGDTPSLELVWCYEGSSPTRGIYAGGSSPSRVNNINFITISTQGNSADFGDLTLARSNGASSMTNAVRMVMAGGYAAASPHFVTVIDFVTIATLGDAIDFGDTSGSNSGQASGSSKTRGVHYIGANTTGNTLEYIEIMTTGNAIDFGDLNSARRVYGTTSNGHGGLG